MGIISSRFNIVLAVIYRELRRQCSIIKIVLNVSVYIAVNVICSVAVTLCPYFSLGFLLSLLDYCVVCSSRRGGSRGRVQGVRRPPPPPPPPPVR